MTAKTQDTTDEFVNEAFRVKQQRDDLLADQLSKAATIARLLQQNADLLADMQIIADGYTTDQERIKIARAAIARAEE